MNAEVDSEWKPLNSKTPVAEATDLVSTGIRPYFGPLNPSAPSNRRCDRSFWSTEGIARPETCGRNCRISQIKKLNSLRKGSISGRRRRYQRVEKLLIFAECRAQTRDVIAHEQTASTFSTLGQSFCSGKLECSTELSFSEIVPHI